MTSARSTPNAIALERATPADLDAIRALLARLELPSQDVGGPNQAFLVARAGDAVLGCAGLEHHGDDALLRSLAVEPERQGQGIGKQLYDGIVAEARRSGVRALYLLTTTAEGFFAKAGFARIDRSQAPVAVASSPEFASLCPASAVCMRLVLR